MAGAVGWSSIVEFQSGQEVSNKFDSAFGKIDDTFVSLSEKDTALEEAIALLQPLYEYTEVLDITVVDTTWQEVARVEITTNPHGDYEFKMSIRFSLDSTINSAIFRCSPDGGVNWTEFKIEPSDITNEYATFYAFPKEVAVDAGISLILEAAKENAGDTMIINSAYVVTDLKKRL